MWCDNIFREIPMEFEYTHSNELWFGCFVCHIPWDSVLTLFNRLRFGNDFQIFVLFVYSNSETRFITQFIKFKCVHYLNDFPLLHPCDTRYNIQWMSWKRCDDHIDCGSHKSSLRIFVCIYFSSTNKVVSIPFLWKLLHQSIRVHIAHIQCTVIGYA